MDPVIYKGHNCVVDISRLFKVKKHNLKWLEQRSVSIREV